MAKNARRGKGRPPVKHPRESISLRLDPDHLRQLDAAADEDGVNRSALIQQMVSQFLKARKKQA
jgi:metal-responsive CopG/Arc/MetJ family transcriptional regulator